MPFNVAGVQAKLARAQHHLDTYKAQMSGFVQPNSEPPFRIVCDGDVYGGEPFIRCEKADIDPLAWSSLVGDFFHNLRSALDHLAHQLADGSVR